jgi:NAD-dependent DNA ligase
MKHIKTKHPDSIIQNIKSANQCLSWWLIHSYLYYRLASPVISDKDFDTLTSWLKMSWDQIDHIHKHLVTIDDLNAGSGYAISYPLMVQSCANRILRNIEENKVSSPIKKVAKSTIKNKIAAEYDTLFG